MKTCTKCGIEKTRDEFAANKARKDGLQPYCRECNKSYRLNNKDKAAACLKAWRSNNSERYKKTTSAWIEANRSVLIEKNRLYYAANKEVLLKKHKEWRSANKDKISRSNSDWYEKNRSNKAASKKVWYEENKTSILKAAKSYRLANAHKYREFAMKRNASKLNQTPKWADVELIEAVYAFAAQFDGYHVDHIVPLQGKVARGLHVPENLRVIPASENISKSNRFDPEAPLPTPTIHTPEFREWLKLAA